MHRKLLAVAVAGALTAPAAFAQTAIPPNVDIGYGKPSPGPCAKTFAKKPLAKIIKAWTRFKTAYIGAMAAMAAKIRAMKTSAKNVATRRTVGYNYLFAPAAGAF